MFDIYQHKLNPAYRLIVACKAELPQEANKDDWNLTRIGVRRVASEAEESVQNVGYHLCKPVSTFAETRRQHADRESHASTVKVGPG
jgi:hypothetical protein